MALSGEAVYFWSYRYLRQAKPRVANPVDDDGTGRRMSCCASATSRSFAGNPGSSWPPASGLRSVTSARTPPPALLHGAVCRPSHAGRPCAGGYWLNQRRFAFPSSCSLSRRPHSLLEIGNSPTALSSVMTSPNDPCSCRQLVTCCRMNGGLGGRREILSRALCKLPDVSPEFRGVYHRRERFRVPTAVSWPVLEWRAS